MFHFPKGFATECSPECPEYIEAPAPSEAGEHFFCETHVQWWFGHYDENSEVVWSMIDIVPWALWRDIGYLTPPS